MIRRRTVFVVGAGASEPYGLPIASALSTRAKALTPSNEWYQLLGEVLGLPAVASLIEDLRDHPALSIDAFLQHREHIPSLRRSGKAVLAGLMGSALSQLPSKPRPSDNAEWIARIITTMSEGAPSAKSFAIAARNVSFVTFNFDTLVEDETARLLRAIYRGDDGIGAAVEAVRVHHIHGRLSLPPKEQMFIGSQLAGGYRNGVSKLWIDWTTSMVDEIKVVLDEAEPSIVATAQELIREAEILCFMGFSYDRSNLEKLGLIRSSKPEDRKIYGTAFALHDSTRERVNASLATAGGIRLGGVEEKCIHLLNSHYILRDL